MNLIVHFTVLSLFYFYSFLLGTEAGKHGHLVKPSEPRSINIPPAILSEFYTFIDSQQDNYEEAIEKVKAKKPHRNKKPKPKTLDTENELRVGRRNFHKIHKKNGNTRLNTLDVGEFAKYSREDNSKNVTKSKKRKNLKRSKQKNFYKRIDPNTGENSPLDIIIHIKMREPRNSVNIDENNQS